jgi:hypothetical protein
MTGYAVSSRIGQVELRSPLGQAILADGRSDPMAPPTAEGALEDLAGRGAWARFHELRDDLVSAWRQTTFYLFDPDSWR